MISIRVLIHPPVPPTRVALYLRTIRYNSTAPEHDLRSRLLQEVKAAMKNKDTLTSMTLRSVLSEVYTVDKSAQEKVPSSTIAAILRRAAERRIDAASKFTAASRSDLAAKEHREAEIISRHLPPLLSEAEVDTVLTNILNDLPATVNPQKNLGLVFKEFYSQIDKSRVNANLVKTRVHALLASAV